MKSIAALALFVILSPLPVQGVPQFPGLGETPRPTEQSDGADVPDAQPVGPALAFATSLSGFTRLVQDPRFEEPKVQMATELTAGIGIDFGGLVRIGTRLGMDVTFASDFSGGYYYRGHIGLGLGVSIGAPYLLRLGDMALGVEASGAFSFLAPLQTRLLTFYPSMGLALLATPAYKTSIDSPAPGLRWTVSLPVTLAFRRDLRPVVSIGLGVRVAGGAAATPSVPPAATHVDPEPGTDAAAHE